MPVDEKYSKKAVRYGPSTGGDRCGVCKYFYHENERSETGRCRKVEGSIGENMWCKLFQKK